MARALIDTTADVGVLALGVLTKDEHVDRAGHLAVQRAVHAVVQIRGTQANALVEAAANRQQQAIQRDVVLHARMTDRSEQHRIVLGQFIKELGRSHSPVSEVVVSPPRELGPRDVRANTQHCGVCRALCFASHFGADAVSANHGDALCRHERPQFSTSNDPATLLPAERNIATVFVPKSRAFEAEAGVGAGGNGDGGGVGSYSPGIPC